jgi:hypothetical protein
MASKIHTKKTQKAKQLHNFFSRALNHSYMVLEQGALTGKYNINNPLPEGSARARKLQQIISAVRKPDQCNHRRNRKD